MYIYINNSLWNIEFVPWNSSILRNYDGQYTLGVTIPNWRKIYIANNISGELLKRVISHEVAHTEFWTRGLIVPVYIEEILADAISDNIVDTNNQTNNICRIIGKC